MKYLLTVTTVSLLAILFLQSNVSAQGNEILGFQVISDRPNELVIEVNYVYSGNMGDKIGMSAGVSGEKDYKIGVTPAWVHTGRNVAKIQLSAIEERASGPFSTRDLRFYMYDQTSGNKVSAVKRFSYKKDWLVDRSAMRKDHPSYKSQKHQNAYQIAYQVHGYSKAAGGAFKATIQFVSRYKAKLKMNHSSHGGGWIDMSVETVSKRNVRMFAMLSSGNSMDWNVVFSRDMSSLDGNVIMSGSNKSNFEISGRRIE